MVVTSVNVSSVTHPTLIYDMRHQVRPKSSELIVEHYYQIRGRIIELRITKSAAFWKKRNKEEV